MLIIIGVSYPGFEGQQNLGQEEDEALEADGEVLEDKVSDADHPDQVEEVHSAQVGLGKHEAVGVLESSLWIMLQY